MNLKLEEYRELFEVVLATTEELRQRVYRLRYQVYCVENEFEDPAENPEGVESDVYDPFSMHSLLIHRPSGRDIGTVRLIRSTPGVAGSTMPIFECCETPQVNSLKQLQPSRLAEVSRFSVSEAFRPRIERGSDARAASRATGRHLTRQILQYLNCGLISSVIEMAMHCNISHLCALMDPALMRLLAIFGLNFVPVGPMIDYHGFRQPSMGEFEPLVTRMRLRRPDVWEIATDGGRLQPAKAGLNACLNAASDNPIPKRAAT